MVGVGTSRAIGELLTGVVHSPSIERFTMDGAEGLAWLADGIRSAERRIVGHNSGINNADVGAAFVEARESGLDVRLLTDPEFHGSPTHWPLQAAGVDMTSWGGNAYHPKHGFDARINPRKIHAKHVTFDDHSWVSSASMSESSTKTIETTAIVGGDDTRALARIAEAGLADDGDELVAAAAAARTRGILLNDLTYGIDHLTTGYEDAIRGATTELVVGYKVVEDRRLARLVAAAADRGVDVTLVTKKRPKPKQLRRILHDVRVVLDPDARLHGNAVVVDGEFAVFGSAHATPRALVRGSTRRASHELGLATDDPLVVESIRSALLGIG